MVVASLVGGDRELSEFTGDHVERDGDMDVLVGVDADHDLADRLGVQHTGSHQLGPLPGLDNR